MICNGCDVDVERLHELGYMLRPTLWWVVEPTEHGFLCIGCVEERLGRELDLHDFDLMTVNTTTDLKRSERLTNRLRGFRERYGMACERSQLEVEQYNARG